MSVPMVRVRVMRMRVHHDLVMMHVAVPRAGGSRRNMRVLVMRIAHAVHMFVFMIHRLVRMLVLVPLREVQRDAERHEHARSEQRHSHSFA